MVPESKQEEEKDAISQKNDEQAVLKLVQEVKEETGKYREQFEKGWKEGEDFYYGKQHKTGENLKTTKNHLFKIIEGEVPILSDSMAGTTILSDREDRQDDALILEKSIRYVYNDQNLQLQLPSLIRSSLMSAPGYLYTYYDPDGNNGDGKVCIKKIPWKSVFLDGNVSLLEDAAKARIEVPMRKDAVARMFPQKKDEILKQQSNGSSSIDIDNEDYETRDVSGTGDKMSTGAPKEYKAKDIINYVETWVKSYDLKDIENEETFEEIQEELAQIAKGEAPDIGKWEDHAAHIQSHEGILESLLAKLGMPLGTEFEQVQLMAEQVSQQNPEADFGQILLQIKILENHIEEHEELMKLNPTSQEPKYKDGWRVIKTVGKVILYDGPNVEENGEIPIVPFYCYKDDTIYGFPESKNIIDPQKTLNEMDYKEYKGLKRVANPGWIADHESGITSDKLTNEDGIVVIKAKGTEVRRLEPGQISPQLERRMQNDILAMEDISGVNEATQGRTPSPNASGAAISSLQNQAIGRIRLKDRYIQHYSMKRLARLVSSLIINNWSTEKRLRLNTDTASVEELIFDPLKMSDLAYSVEITPGSMAGTDKEALNSFYFNMLAAGHIPFKEFLLVADFPKREILLKSAMEREKMQGEQEAQAQEQAMMQQQQSQDQSNQELIKLKTENMKLRATINPELLSKEEKQILEEVMRNEANESITGNVTPNQGQVNNQGF